MRVATPTQRRPHGFTLIEAMMTVAIVAILGAIAYPQYVEFITRSRIIDGTSKMSNFRVQMEQYFMDNRTYLNGAACGVPNIVAGAQDYFGITCLGTATTYTITGQGVGPMANFKYTVDQTNARQTLNANPGWNFAGSTCWVTKKDGTC
jgi:type IV pilus assembly protein PilE